jgi:hypothetical protein
MHKITKKGNTNYHHIEQRSPEWFDLKKEYPLSASRAGDLLTYGAEKLIEFQPTSWGGNYWTKRGELLEKPAIELYEQIKGVRTKSIGFITNKLYPLCGYSPDDYLPDRFIEVKCFNKDKHLSLREKIPFEVMAQIQFGLFVGEKDITDLVAYNPDLEPEDCLIITTIERDEGIHKNFKRIINKVKYIEGV